MNNMGLGFLFTAKDLASGAIDNLGNKLSSLQGTAQNATQAIDDSMRRVTKGLGIMAAGAATLGGAFLLANASGDFEQAIAQVGAVANATAEDLKLLEQAAIQAGIQTQYSPIEAARGLRELAAAGYSARESVDLLVPVLNLAAGSLGELTVESSAGLAAQAIKAFGLETKDAALVVDQLIQATNTFALSAADLPLALGTAARGAAATNQSLGDTLVALGLVKNIIPGIERSSTAVSVAMEKMANPATQKALRGLGVTVANSDGSFRSLLDVLGEMAPALDKMTDVKRAGFLQKTFGAEALAGINAILTQMTKGIKAADGTLLRGGDALAYLRKQMNGAGGAAQAFADQNLATFNGQKTLLKGSMETLAIELGKPLVQVLKPVVKGMIWIINTMIEALQNMPEGFKRFMAGAVVVVSFLAIAAGAALAAKGAFVLLGFAFKAAAVALGPFLAAAGPALAIIGAIGLASYALYKAVETNFGGLADVIMAPFRTISLAWRATVQLFSDGEFSGEVLKELDKGHSGIMRFAITIYQAWHRIDRFLTGIGDGFRSMWDSYVSPIVDELEDAFRGVGEAVTQLQETFSNAFGALVGEIGGVMPASKGFASAGELIGGVIAKVIGWFAKALTYAVHFTGFLISGFTDVINWAMKLGDTIGDVAGKIYVWFAERVPGVFGKLAEFARAAFEPVIAFFDRVVTAIDEAITRIFDTLVSAVRKMPDWAVPEGLAGMKTSEEERADAKRRADLPGARAAVASMPAVAQAEVTAAQSQLVGGDAAGFAALVKALQGGLSRPVVIQVNGETIARAAVEGQMSIDERGFTPVATR